MNAPATADYCREIETYLCRKNDGHLIRVVGPSFDLVSDWAARGVPLKVAYSGIDRYFERYYAKGPRRRPVRIDFCEADVLDVFDEWRRAVGLIVDSRQSTVNSRQSTVDSQQSTIDNRRPALGRRQSLPEHLERVLLRLTSARVSGALDAPFDELVDRVARELDASRENARGVRGEARQALVGRLAELDRELIAAARLTLDTTALSALALEADEELAQFRTSMAADAYSRTREAAIDRLVRHRFHLPTIEFT